MAKKKIQKRIAISEKTMDLLKRLDEDLSEHPRSIECFEKALERVVEDYYKNITKIVRFDSRIDKTIDGLLEYGIINNRQEFLLDAVKNAVRDRKESLIECIDQEIAAKKKEFGI